MTFSFSFSSIFQFPIICQSSQNKHSKQIQLRHAQRFFCFLPRHTFVTDSLSSPTDNFSQFHRFDQNCPGLCRGKFLVKHQRNPGRKVETVKEPSAGDGRESATCVEVNSFLLRLFFSLPRRCLQFSLLFLLFPALFPFYQRSFYCVLARRRVIPLGVSVFKAAYCGSVGSSIPEMV